MRTPLAVLTLIAAFAAPVLAHADTFDFTMAGTASGTLNGVSFTGQSLTVTGTYTTGQIQEISSTDYVADIGPVTYTISGFGSFSSSDATNDLFVSGSILGIGAGGPDILDLSSSTYNGYNLNSSLGPVASTTFYAGSDGTVDGALSFRSVTGASFTTTDVMAGGGPIISSTPEPSSLMLLSTGAFGVAGLVRRRFRRA